MTTPAAAGDAGLFLRTPGRVAIAGDWHADADYAVATIAHARRRNADVIIQLGDFGYRFDPAYLDRLDRALRRRNLILGFVDGNHEDFDRLLSFPLTPDGLRPLRERIVHLPRGFRWRWGSVSCLALGGARSLDEFLRVPGVSWWPQEEIDDDEAAAVVAGGLTDAMFCHDCPAGVDVPGTARARFGFPAEAVEASEAHRRRLRAIVDRVQPHRLWHGHFHQRYHTVTDGPGYRTVIDGLGRNGDPVDNNMVVVPLAVLGTHPRARRHGPALPV